MLVAAPARGPAGSGTASRISRRTAATSDTRSAGPGGRDRRASRAMRRAAIAASGRDSGGMTSAVRAPATVASRANRMSSAAS
jgi:hypothetical protein